MSNYPVHGYILAAFAVLFVVDKALPKTEFLTKIDIVIVLTIVNLAVTGFVSLVLDHMHTDDSSDDGDDKASEHWTLLAVAILCGIYVLGNLAILCPPLLQQRRAIAALDGYTQSSSTGTDYSDDRDIEDQTQSPQVVSQFSSANQPGNNAACVLCCVNQ